MDNLGEREYAPAMGFWNPRAICPNCGAKIHTQAGGWATGRQCPACGVALTGTKTFFSNEAKLAPPPVEPGQGALVRLVDPGKKKIHVIKAVRTPTGMGLKEAKELVDSAPSLIECRDEESADVMVAEFETHGATYERIVRDEGGKSPAPGEPEVAGRDDVDPTEQIRKLGALRDDGLLTQEEFEAKKADLLSRL